MAKYSSIASRWRELSGENDWNGLLDPLHHDLRRYIIHYGQMAGSVGDVYKYNKEGELSKDKFFETGCIEKGNDFKYAVTDYLHAGSSGSWVVKRAWFGFVAVTTDEGKAVLGRRDILIIWRGTAGIGEWFNNLNIKPKFASELFGPDTEAKVHSGFLTLYISAREQVQVALREVMKKYRDEEISITVAGFSLGGALATLNAMDIVYNGYNKRSSDGNDNTFRCMVTAFTYGSPRVGTDSLKQVFNRLVNDDCKLRLLRIRNVNDVVTIAPPLPNYQHVGTELSISSNYSKYLKNNCMSKEYAYDDLPNDKELKELLGDTTDRGVLGDLVADKFSAHNMDVYLHVIALEKEGARLVVDHDFALLNKHLDCLKQEHNIPPRWWDGENRGIMVQQDNGHWIVNNNMDNKKNFGSSQGPTKRALLVGCNYTKTKFRLHGCINDVAGMKKLIEEYYGFKPDNVKVLTDDASSSIDLPTHINIMNELDDMVNKAKAGDVLFFHFSGHGTHIPSLEPGQAYKEGEAIVPCDLNLITDMDLRHLIQKLEPGTSFTLLSDSCHSGGLIDKDKEQIGPRKQKGIPHPDYHCKSRFLPFAFIIPCLQSVVGIANTVVTDLTGTSIIGHLGNALTGIFPKDKISLEFQPQHKKRKLLMSLRSLTEDEGILLSGCQANETSADVSDIGIAPHGAFTSAVLRVLKLHRGEAEALTNKKLVMEARSLLQDQEYDQHPCLYCSDDNANAPFLGIN